MKKGWGRLAGLTVVAIIVAAVLALLPRSRPYGLLDRTTKVADVAGWNLRHADYHWLSDHEILYFRGDDIGGRTSHWTLMRRDTRTGRDEELKGLTAVFQRTLGSPWSMSLTPDRTAMMWSVGAGIYAATLDGHRLFRASCNSTSSAELLPDKRHWVELVHNLGSGVDYIAGAVVRDGERPGGITASFTPQFPSPMVTVVTDDGRLVMQTGQGGTPQAPVVTTTALAPTAKSISQLTSGVVLPADTWPNAVAYSRHGDQAAWLLDRYLRPSAFSLWLDSLLRRATLRQHTGTALWVSGLRAEQMREIGSFEQPNGGSGATWNGIGPHLHWLPDGKSVSFVYAGSLRRIPIR